VARAGLKVRVVDVDPQTLDYDYDALEQADFTRVLAVASANLYGLPNDLPRLAAIAHRHHAFVLDDAAQSMEARVGGGWSGTLGDVGFFSLDKGKNITTVDGGIVVTNRDDIGALLEARIERLPQPSARTRLACLAKLFVYSGFLRPRLYWIPESLPFLGLGTTPYPDDIRLEAYPAFLAGVGRRLFARIGELTAVRVRNATLAMERLARLPSLQFVQVVAGASPVYLRLPVFVKGNDRDRAIAALKVSGIGASASFPTSVVDIPGIDSGLFRGPLRAEGGRRVARHILTLPTHPYVDASSLERAARILSKCTAG
jgi:dTDP-4-amino-4,6-dideoxygalactose transaminase